MYFHPKNRICRKADVLNLLRISKSAFYNRISDGLFPPPISLGGRAKGWVEQEVQATLNAMVSGKSKEELRALVSQIVSERSNAGQGEA